MRKNKASTTARLVALWRALADQGVSVVPGFSDPMAHSFLRGGWGLVWQVASRLTARMSPEARARFAEGIGMMVLRVAFLDDRLLASVRAGATQVVILGAGYDTRAWRLAPLAGTVVYEVDHPATQARKRELASTLPAPAATVRWVPVDFERDSLASALAAAGHDGTKPTVWLWEGVVMYLGDQALRSSLAAIRAASSPGSAVLLHYHEPGERSDREHARQRVFRWLGEPQIGLRSRETIARELGDAGFVLAEDAGLEEQAAATGGRAPNQFYALVSRVCVARVAASASP